MAGKCSKPKSSAFLLGRLDGGRISLVLRLPHLLKLFQQFFSRWAGLLARLRIWARARLGVLDLRTLDLRIILGLRLLRLNQRGPVRCILGSL